MTLASGEFIRRFLIHVLPSGFHRIRHYGLFASSNAPRTSRAHVNCSPSRSLRARMPTPLTVTSRKHLRIHARAAAGA
jgi:hypothetical protein